MENLGLLAGLICATWTEMMEAFPVLKDEKNLIRKYILQEGQQGPEGFRKACSSTSNLLLFRFAFVILLSSFSFASLLSSISFLRVRVE